MRTYAAGNTIRVVASPRFQVLFIFGLTPVILLAQHLQGHSRLGGLLTLCAFGVGWSFWWCFLRSKPLAGMRGLLVASPDTILLNTSMADNSPSVADSTTGYPFTDTEPPSAELRDPKESPECIHSVAPITPKRPSLSLRTDQSSTIPTETALTEVPLEPPSVANLARAETANVSRGAYQIACFILFILGLGLGIALGAKHSSVDLRHEYERQLKSHLARFDDDPTSTQLATLQFNRAVGLSPLEKANFRNDSYPLDAANLKQSAADAMNLNSLSPITQSQADDIPNVISEGTPPHFQHLSLPSLADSSARAGKPSDDETDPPLHPDRATRAVAFGLYELGVAATRKASEGADSQADTLWQSATRLLTSAISVDPSFCDPQIVLACIYSHHHNDLQKSRQLLANVIRNEPLNAEAQYYAAVINYNHGNHDGALANLNRTIDLDPYFGLAYRLRSKLFEARQEPDDAALDAQLFNSLDGSVAADYVFPWINRSVPFRSKETGLFLRHSSEWLRFTSVVKGTELRLIRSDQSRSVALSVIYLGEVFPSSEHQIDAVQSLVEAFTESVGSVDDAVVDRLGRGELILNGQSVPWLDLEVKSPPLMANRSRFFLLRHAQKWWSVRFSTFPDEHLFQKHLPAAESILRSISFN